MLGGILTFRGGSTWPDEEGYDKTVARRALKARVNEAKDNAPTRPAQSAKFLSAADAMKMALEDTVVE